MKKLLLIFPVLFLFVSCGTQSPKPVRGFTADIVSEYNYTEIKAELVADESRYISLRFDSPESMKGSTYIFTDGKVKITSDSAKVSAEDNYLPDTAFPKIVYNVLISLGREGNLQNNSQKEYNGSCDSGKFNLTVDDSGRITAISIKALGFAAQLVHK